MKFSLWEYPPAVADTSVQLASCAWLRISGTRLLHVLCKMTNSVKCQGKYLKAVLNKDLLNYSGLALSSAEVHNNSSPQFTCSWLNLYKSPSRCWQGIAFQLSCLMSVCTRMSNGVLSRSNSIINHQVCLSFNLPLTNIFVSLDKSLHPG